MFNHLNMFKRQLYTDITIKIGNVSVNSHKCVLAGNSKLFEEMIEQSVMFIYKNLHSINI